MPPDSPPPQACTIIGEASDAATLAELASTHGAPLLVATGSVLSCACAESRRHASDDEARRHASDDEVRRHASDDEARRHASDDEERRHASDDESRRHASDDESRRHASDDESRRHASDDEQRIHDGATDDRRFGGAMADVHCSVAPNCAGFVVDLEPPFQIFDGANLRAATGTCVPF